MITTLKDIALEAGVSVMTVSNVVNGNLSKVSKENAKRIQKIVAQKGYVPNASARSLVKNKANIIAIVLRSNEAENALENPYNAALVGTIIQKIQSKNYYTMVHMMKSREDITQSLRTWNVDGAVFLGMFDNEIEEMCSVSNVPMVFIDSYSNVRQLSNIGIDDYKGGQLAARHFIAKGHRSIAFISPPVLRVGVVQHRYAGFCDELARHGLSVKKEHQFVLESDVDPEKIIELGQQLAGKLNEITAAFVTSDQIASYLMQGLHSAGAKVPRDLSLIGFDNLAVCRQIVPQLTTIAQNLEEKAKLSMEILFRRLSEPAAAAESLVLDVELVERESVREIPPCP